MESRSEIQRHTESEFHFSQSSGIANPTWDWDCKAFHPSLDLSRCPGHRVNHHHGVRSTLFFYRTNFNFRIPNRVMPGEEDEEENNVTTMSRKRRWPGRIKGAVVVLELFLKNIFHSILSQMFSSLYHISGEVVKDELDEMPKESQAQNGLENSEKGKKESNNQGTKILFEKTWRRRCLVGCSRSTRSQRLVNGCTWWDRKIQGKSFWIDG